MRNKEGTSELPWISDWVAHPMDGAVIASFVAFGMFVLVYILTMGITWISLVSAVAVWGLLFGGYMVARRTWDLGEDVPLSFGRDTPYNLSGYKFLIMFLARNMAVDAGSFDLNNVLAAAGMVGSYKDEHGRPLFMVTFGEVHGVINRSRVESSLNLLRAEGHLQVHAGRYAITDEGRELVAQTAFEFWDQDSQMMDALADILGFSRALAVRPRPQ